jgi:hypothetical protein
MSMCVIITVTRTINLLRLLRGLRREHRAADRALPSLVSFRVAFIRHFSPHNNRERTESLALLELVNHTASSE